jgi:hypothetical protein
MHTLHKLPEGFIVTSKPLNDGRDVLVYNPITMSFRQSGSFILDINELEVIAQQHQIDFSALSEEEQKKIGWFDVESLANQQFDLDTKKIPVPTSLWYDSQDAQYHSFIKGFKKAQELLSDRRFTLEDMHKAYDAGMVFIGEDKGSPIEFYQSLSQPKSWSVELEMINDYEEPEGDFVKPKLTDGKVKILKIL